MRVMLVEDSTPLRGIVRQMLNQLGYDEIVEAGDGQEAWEKMAGYQFDLLLTDWNMPRMSGLELLQRVRQTPQMANLPVVMLTTRNNKQDIISAVKAGVNNYVTKPCKPSQLKEKIEKAVQQAQKQVQKEGQKPVPRSAPTSEEIDRIIHNCRKYHANEKGPYVLFYESPMDVRGISEGKSPEVAWGYGQVAEVIEGINSAYPGMEGGYSIEHETKAVARLVKDPEEQVKMVMISARSSEGFSLARMIGFSRREGGPPIYLLCDSIAGLSIEQRDGVVKMGVELMERRDMIAERLQTLFEKYLVPEARTTASGLKYLELVKGPGRQPVAGQLVAVHYTGMLQDGKVFDDSRKRGEPFQFEIGKGIVIDGWEEGISLMNQGGSALLVIPPELGYGSEGDGKVIPPNATLIFNVELVEVSDPGKGKGDVEV